jgi:ABC-type dipeptide/oligopeptide/nickel transport system ATPase subunit
MKRIKEIKIKNFKAFQQEESFILNGKHLLVYGNNGSGKSSLFWALYTFLQSSTKTNEDVQKYFLNYIESDKSTHQTLKNIFMDEAENAYIQITSIDTESSIEVIYTVSHDIINTNTNADTIIQELNLASDFINYKLLHNFYREPHKQEINLWSVFERDIFPFLTDGTQNWLEDIIKTPTLDIPRTQAGYAVTRGRKQRYIDELDTLNTRIQTLLTEIQDNANTFIKDHFFQGKDVIRVELNFEKKFNFDLVKSKIWQEDRQSYRHEQLQIKLSVEVYEATPTPHWKSIERVQSFLNEAQLTRIAIGIRIGALRTRPLGAARFKILVLDDMLISLDFSNRMDVVRIILNTDNDPNLENIFGEFQKIILTHDLGFYELIKRHTSPHEWEYFKFHKATENINEAPNVKRDLNRMEKAEFFLLHGEYEACGNELRKEVEDAINKYLESLNLAGSEGTFKSVTERINRVINIRTKHIKDDFNRVFTNLDINRELIEKLNTDFENDPDLTENEKGKLRGLRKKIVKYLVKQSQLEHDDEGVLNEIKELLIRIMNPASHASLVPLYEGELTKAIQGVIRLKEILNQTES